MKLLNYNELIGLREAICTNKHKQIDEKTMLAFNILSVTGLRVQELYNISSAEHSGGSLFVVNTLKGSNQRVIDFARYTEVIKECIAVKKCIFMTYSKVTLARNFYKACNYNKLIIGKKAVETHFFRHVAIKELYENGNSIDVIKNKFGLSSNIIVQNYVYSEIYAMV